MHWKKPTVQMLGRFQPWHDGHTELFKKALEKTGQVCIMIRDTGGNDDDNPFHFDTVCKNIETALGNAGYNHKQYQVLQVPNIVDISYGRGVGYTFTEHDLGEDIHKISATEIRKKMSQTTITNYDSANTVYPKFNEWDLPNG